ncbi:MAG: Rne/Rng family ribonuclease [Armatimonadetes bacterium]|nr:Rne/Rng family ribonuclease [Armatimonadota bacterium]MDW8028814.1 Rne/Rng family ribonuclease [Armatimonadota bacterium]
MKLQRQVLVLVECDPVETRVAVLENGKVVDLEVEREPRIVENVYKGVVKNITSGIDAAFVDIGLERNGFIHVSDIVPGGVGVSGTNKEQFRTIQEAVREGDEILVQITRYGGPRKGVRLTTRIGIRGHYCVLLCQGSDHVGVSVKITDERMRERLRKLGEQLRPLDCGLIIRYHAANATPEAIAFEVEQLYKRWQKMVKDFAHEKAPSLLFSRPSIFADLLWDIAPPDTHRIIVDSEEEAERIRALAKELRPEFADRIEVYRGRSPLFEHFNVEPQLRTLFEPIASLPSGGYLVIEETEAATIIDVNTGRYTGSKNAAQTIMNTNQEAIEEVARQMKLRDLSGIILVDLIDVLRSRDRNKLMNLFEQLVRKDRTPTKIVDLTPLGLVEITRHRRGESLWKVMTKPCPHCQGRGRVKTALTLSIELRKKIRSFAATLSQSEKGEMVICAHPEVASWLVLEEENMNLLEQQVGRPIIVLVNPSFPQEHFTFSLRSSETIQPSLVGAEFICSFKALLPPEEPMFAVHGNRLVRLNSDGNGKEFVTVQIVDDGRWFCEGEVKVPNRVEERWRWGT